MTSNPESHLASSSIQRYCAKGMSAYPRAREPHVPTMDAHFRPIRLAIGPAARLPPSIPNEAMLTEMIQIVLYGKFLHWVSG